MVITHHGGQCVKVTFGDLTLAFDPIGKDGTLDPVRFGADIALCSRKLPDMHGVESVTYGEREPFVIDGPGEYEYMGVTVQGFATKSTYKLPKGEQSAINTVYAVKLENMTLVFLGALSEPTLPMEAREALDTIDILFMPVGGGEVLDAAQAEKLSVLLEPSVIIPIHHKGMGEKGSLDAFLKEGGRKSERVDKLIIKKKEAGEKDGTIIVVTS